MPQHKNRKRRSSPPKIKSKLFNIPVTDQILYTVMNQESHPICRTEVGSHAVACAVARTAIDSILDKIAYISTCIEDLNGEDDHTPEKLDEHVDMLLETKGILSETLDKLDADLEASGIRRVDTENAVNRVLRLVPGTNKIFSYLEDTFKLLDGHVKKQMRGLHELELFMSQQPEHIKAKINRGEDPETKKKIKALIKGDLTRMLNKVRSARSKTISIQNKLVEEWQAVTDQLLLRELGCAPISERPYLP
ncbi:hypothetical protein ACFL5Z_09265 [Planctomycetota bacterium]